MSFELWLAFLATETVLCFVPGPAVLLVVSVAMSRGARAGLAASFGILAGNALYFLCSATGVAALILASSRLFGVLQSAGAAYLVWLGLCMLLAPGRAPAAVTPQPLPRSFLRGFVVQTANPKALIFFVALLPQFIHPAAPVGPQVLILGITSVLIELLVLALYTGLAVRARRLAGARFAGRLERLGGGFLVAAGARLALVRAA